MNNNEILVKAEDVSKKFCKDLKTSLWYGFKDLYANIFGNVNQNSLRDKEFWAVNNISFELKRGECLGLIGHNGAGKSTLLKMLNGLINPDGGRIEIRGRVGALIELGAGFNPILSGRENIYNNGAVLGFTKKEIDAKIDTIIDFSELREFIDMPVQNYSSGMKVRLGFAVAAQMEPDVLIIDEVLAVGDLGFILKCFKTIDNLLMNTAVIFVSHSMPMVSRICSQIILMEKGESSYQGTNVAKAIDKYYERFSINDSDIVFSDKSIELEQVNFLEPNTNKTDLIQLNWLDDIKINFKFKINTKIETPIFAVSIFDKEQRPVALFHPNTNEDISIVGDAICFTISHKNLQLSKGVYTINVTVGKQKTKEPILRINGILSFQVISEEEVWPPFLLTSKYENY